MESVDLCSAVAFWGITYVVMHEVDILEQPPVNIFDKRGGGCSDILTGANSPALVYSNSNVRGSQMSDC